MTAMTAPDDAHHGGHHVTWFKVDDTLPFHHKVVAAGNAAMGLWVRAGGWSAQQLTDGYVPRHMINSLGTPAQARRLVHSGLWTEVEEGYQFHQWNEDGRQPERTLVLERRKKESARKAKAREAKSAKQQVTVDSPQGTDAGHPRGHPKGVRSTRPDPSLKRTTEPLRGSAEDPRDGVASGDKQPTEVVRAQKITDLYVEQVPLSKYPAVLGIVRKALHCKRYSDDAVRDALLRLAADGRSVTVDSLRTELDGLPATRSRPSTTDARVAAAQALKAKIRAKRAIEP